MVKLRRAIVLTCWISDQQRHFLHMMKLRSVETFFLRNGRLSGWWGSQGFSRACIVFHCSWTSCIVRVWRAWVTLGRDFYNNYRVFTRTCNRYINIKHWMVQHTHSMFINELARCQYHFPVHFPRLVVLLLLFYLNAPTGSLGHIHTT